MEVIENFFLSKYSQEKLIKWFRINLYHAEAISWFCFSRYDLDS